MVEIALMAPWIFFLFVGIYDFGFYAYSAIATQNAAREAAVRAATFAVQSSSEACQAALDEMKMLPNTRSQTVCAGTGSPTSTNPIDVTLTTLCGANAPTSLTCTARPTSPTCADCAADTTAASAQATVYYKTLSLIPIPGVLPQQLTMVRKAEVRIIQ